MPLRSDAAPTGRLRQVARHRDHAAFPDSMPGSASLYGRPSLAVRLRACVPGSGAVMCTSRAWGVADTKS